MTNKKYELTDETKNIDSNIVYRIRSLINFKSHNINVHKGDFGGFVSKEENLSHDGSCWIFDNAVAFDNSKVFENAILEDDTVINGSTVIGGDAIIQGDTTIISNSEIGGESIIIKSSVENCKINFARILNTNIESSQIDSFSAIYESLILDSHISESIIQNSIIEDSEIESLIYNSKITFGAIKDNYDYINMGPFHRELYTFYKSKDGTIFARENNYKISEGFTGSIDNFIAFLKDVDDYNKKSEDMIKYIKMYFNENWRKRK